MIKTLRVIGVLVILLSIVFRLSAGTRSEDFHFIDALTDAALEQGAEIVATRIRSSRNGFVSFLLPTCPETITFVPFEVSRNPEVVLAVNGLEGEPFVMAYFDYAGAYPGKFRLLTTLVLERAKATVTFTPQMASASFGVLIVDQGNCDRLFDVDIKRLWRSADQT